MIRLGKLVLLAGDFLVYLLVRLIFLGLRAMGPDRASAFGGAVARRIGKLLPAHKLAADNIARAFPDLDDAARAKILDGAWDNLGRMSCEYVHMAEISAFSLDSSTPSRMDIPQDVIDQFLAMRDDGKPALVFTGHLANWELPPILATHHEMQSAVLYRTPNNRFVANYILRLRTNLMGRLIGSGGTAPIALAAALERGEHVGMLVDQRFGRGPRIPFFGRPAATNTLFAKLARHFDCPVYGVRAIRLPGVRFRMDIVGPLELPRDAEGQVDIEGATRAITQVIEDWVREYPAQWLWMHRRWRV